MRGLPAEARGRCRRCLSCQRGRPGVVGGPCCLSSRFAFLQKIRRALWPYRVGQLLALLAGAVRPAAAQGGWLRGFGPAEGLAPPFIYCLAQDRAGYLWLGTAEGLVRFDGTTFVAYTRREGLADDFVSALRADPTTGRLWVGHAGGAYSRQGADGRFAPALAPPAEAVLGRRPPGTPAPDTAALGRYLRRYRLALPPALSPTCVLEDREGNAWFGTAGQGLWRHADRHLRRAAAASSGPLVATNAGRAALRRLPAGLVPTAQAVQPGVGRWVGTAADGLYLLPLDGRRPVQHLTTAQGLLHNAVTALLLDRAGHLWVGSEASGLAELRPGAAGFAYHKLSRTGTDITCLAEDAAGTLWVGTEGQGLYRHRPGQPPAAWQHYTAAAGNLPADYVYGLLPLPTGEVLLSHRTGLTLLLPAAAAAQAPRFAPLAAPGNPLARELLPGAYLLAPDTAAVPARHGPPLRVALAAARQAARLAPPGLVLPAPEVDGLARPLAGPGRLGTLAAGPHRLDFAFGGIGLSPLGGALQYQYRLRGLANGGDAWSRPGPQAEARFPGLGPGTYALEARVRRGPGGPWSAPVALRFGIAPPVWQTGWFAALVLLAVAGAVYGALRGRIAFLRQQQRRLLRTVDERTAELRDQNTHIEHINADLVVARDAAEQSQRIKAQFLANMSHEIRTPMNAVVGLTHLLQATRPTLEQREYLTAIASSSQNLLVIINDILDSSKMEAGKLTLERVPFRLPEALHRLEAMFRFATETKGLYLRVDVPAAVPKAVVGDPVRLNQILVNLVGNAIKFTRQGGVTLRAEVLPPPAAAAGTQAPEAENLPERADNSLTHSLIHSSTHSLIRFSVRDTGIGIAADKLGAIFEDFSQANTSTTREFGGTGLGLSIARNLVQLHGGQLGVTSVEGEGSVFFFELAYETASAASAQPAAHTGHLAPFEPALRVLVAEDNELNQLVARKTLEAWNVQVVIAENGRLAVEMATAAAAAAPFDAVLMDVQMPELDGYAATRQLREYFPDAGRLPIIGLTASVLPEDRALALAAGMNDTLAKPFEPAMLYARLAHFTHRPDGPRPAGGAPAAAAPARAADGNGLPFHQLAPPLRPDWHLLEELAGGNEGFLRQVVQTFLAEAPAQEQLLHTALGAQPLDADLLARTAHKLKGQVAYFGVPGLHAHLDELERAARRPGCDDCQPLADQIAGQLAELYPQLEARAAA